MRSNSCCDDGVGRVVKGAMGEVEEAGVYVDEEREEGSDVEEEEEE